MGGGENFGVRVAATDGDNASEGVEITAAFFVEDILHLSLHDHEGLVMISDEGWGEMLLTQAHHFLDGKTGVGFGRVVAGWEFGHGVGLFVIC